jgi:hypothetical protein
MEMASLTTEAPIHQRTETEEDRFANTQSDCITSFSLPNITRGMGNKWGHCLRAFPPQFSGIYPNLGITSYENQRAKFVYLLPTQP